METKTGVSGNGNAPVFWRVLMQQRLPETTLPSFRWQGFIPAYLGMTGSDYAGLLRLFLAGGWVLGWVCMRFNNSAAGSSLGSWGTA